MQYGEKAFSKLDRVRVMSVVSGVVDCLGVDYDQEFSSRNIMQRASSLKYTEVSFSVFLDLIFLKRTKLERMISLSRQLEVPRPSVQELILRFTVGLKLKWL